MLHLDGHSFAGRGDPHRGIDHLEANLACGFDFR
jgi:hypothetical protein